ncbi:hypothetical protein, partial [Paenibacillus sp. P22]
IEGRQEGGWCSLTVKDNGAGLDAAGLDRLRRQLSEPMSDEIGCGTWNVHQRLRYQFGDRSGLLLEAGQGGGFRAELRWRCGGGPTEEEGGGEDGAAAHRG